MSRRPDLAFLLALGLTGLPVASFAYPGGTPTYVTDVAPFCAGCHSSTSADQLAGVPPARVQAELIANKHIASIRLAKAGTPYAKLSEAEREELIAGIQQLDEHATVKLIVPETLSPGQIFEATVEVTGGGGPAIGIALVDSNQRWQARPAGSAGWQVLERPQVIGPDAKLQTRFTDGRNPALSPGISYVNVYGIRPDLTAGKFDTVRVTFRLRAPHEPGSYPLSSVFLYGTEKGSPHGAVETLRGTVPVGGFGANSGRVRFSEVHQIQVR